MYLIRKQAPLLIAALSLCVAVVLLFPYCRYYIDPDATAYLTIAKRYAAGDYARAVNGYWSPLTCWLTAIGIKVGYEVFTSAIIVNTAGALGFLWISNSFFLRFNVSGMMRGWLNPALVIFLASAVYYQSFADLWQCFLLLAALRIMVTERFVRSPALWCLYGLVGALAYFAKAYSFAFFMLNTICCGYFIMSPRDKLPIIPNKGFRDPDASPPHLTGQDLYRSNLRGQHLRSWVKMCSISLVVFLFCSSPWIYLLHEKYGYWMTATAGRLNMSWYLVGHPYYEAGIEHFLPPVYSDSPYYWEDPYFSNGATPQFWSSPGLCRLQLLKIGYNLLKLGNSLNSLSAFMIPVWLMALLIVLSGKIRRHFPKEVSIVSLSLLLFPTGFLLINFEPRYIWYTLPLTMLLGALGLQLVLPLLDKPWLQRLTVIVFALSFTTGAIWSLRPLIHEGREEYLMAQRLKQLGINGRFTGNAGNAADQRKLIRIAYFSGNPYYLVPENLKISTAAQFNQEVSRYKVKYYFQLPESNGNIKATEPIAPDGKPYPEITGDLPGGLRIYSLQ